jgi:hypothetical protein
MFTLLRLTPVLCNFLVDEHDRSPTLRVLRPLLTRIVFLKPLYDIACNAGIKRPIGTGKYIDNVRRTHALESIMKHGSLINLPGQTLAWYAVPTMPIIILVVAIAAMALGGALYYRTANEAVSVPESAATNEAPVTSGMSDMLEAAEGAADAMEQGFGGSATLSDTDSDTIYANGSYTETGVYTSPAGQEEVTVSITLADDVIASATFTGNATNPGSVKNQEKFAEGYSALVVGKKIDEVALTVVNGSSLTGIGFMDALAAIKDEAKL